MASQQPDISLDQCSFTVGYVDNELLIVDPDKSDKDLELYLHAQWY